MNARILLLITDLEIGGTPTVVRELAIRLRPFAHVEVACLKKWGPVADQLRDAGVTVTALDASHALHYRRTVRRLGDLIRLHRVDTVFSFLVHANAAAASAQRRCPGVRSIQSIQTVQPAPKWHWRLQGWIGSCAEAIVVPSRAIAQAAGERSGIAAEKCVVIANAVDPLAYEQTRVFAGPVTRVGYLGRLDPAKRPELLIDMMKSADDTIELHYFGDGPARPSLEAVASKSAARDRIFFHGSVAEPQAALRQIDCLAMPSRIEGFGLVLIEAMAAGVPVVAIAAGGVLDVVTSGENGLLIAPAEHPIEARMFAEAIALLRSDEPRRASLIAAGLRNVREKFSWEVVLPQYRALLGV